MIVKINLFNCKYITTYHKNSKMPLNFLNYNRFYLFKTNFYHIAFLINDTIPGPVH